MKRGLVIGLLALAALIYPHAADAIDVQLFDVTGGGSVFLGDFGVAGQHSVNIAPGTYGNFRIGLCPGCTGSPNAFLDTSNPSVAKLFYTNNSTTYLGTGTGILQINVTDSLNPLPTTGSYSAADAMSGLYGRVPSPAGDNITLTGLFSPPCSGEGCSFVTPANLATLSFTASTLVTSFASPSPTTPGLVSIIFNAGDTPTIFTQTTLTFLHTNDVINLPRSVGGFFSTVSGDVGAEAVRQAVLDEINTPLDVPGPATALLLGSAMVLWSAVRRKRSARGA